jgi:hypothetical protein
MSMEFPVRFFGLLLRILARTLLPWLRKVKEGKIRGFGRRAGDAGRTFEELFKLFTLAFGFGFGWNALVLEGGAWAKKPKGVEAAANGEGQTPAR